MFGQQKNRHEEPRWRFAPDWVLQADVESGFDNRHFPLEKVDAIFDIEMLLDVAEADGGHSGQVVDFLLDIVEPLVKGALHSVQALIEMLFGEVVHCLQRSKPTSDINVDKSIYSQTRVENISKSIAFP